MSVSTTNNRIEQLGTSSTLSFPFKIFAETDLVVYMNGGSTPLTLDTDYSVAGVGEETGGSITLAETPEATDSFLIVRILDLVQETSYPYNDPFPASAHEAALDRLCMVDQQLQEELDRTFTGDITADWSGFTLTMPAASEAAGYVLAVNSGGTGLEWVTNPGGSNVTAWAATLLSDSDAATARTTLGVYGTSEVYQQSETYSRAEADAITDPLATAANRIVDGGCRIADISAPGVSGTRRFGAPTMFAAWADGSPSAGIIGQGLVAWSASGKSVGVAGLTQTGAGSAVHFSHRIEGQSIADLVGKEVAFACKVHHDTGAAIDWIVTLNSADAADNFSAVTQIAESDAQSVDNGAATEITLAATLPAAAANGLEIIVTAQCGAVTSTDFYVSDWRLYQGGSCPPMALLPMATERARVARYFRHGTSAAGSQDDLLFSGDVTSGNTYWAQVQFGVPMRATPAVAVAHVGASGFAAATGSVYQNARGIAEQRTANGTVSGGHFASTWTADARL